MARVALQIVRPATGPVLSNLVELYCHELSGYFGLKIGADGRYGYPGLGRYWDEPEGRFAFFIVADEELAGFVLATRGSPVSDDPSHLDVAEFFVLRALRERGVGAEAAVLLWDQLPGHWIVRAAVQNTPAVLFWRRAVAAYSQGAYSERTLELKGIARQVFELDSRSKACEVDP
jgi:predicted acetyltransferase